MWHYERQGKPVGPFPEPTILEQIQSGMIVPETMVWKHGMANWCVAGDTELQNLFTGASTMPAAGVPEATSNPLDATTAPPPQTSASPVEYHEVRSTRGLTNIVKGLLALYIAMMLIAAMSGLAEISFINRVQDGGFSTEDAMERAAVANDSRQMMIGLLQLGAILVTSILVLRWIYVSAKNLPRMGATNLSFTPGWCVGWYFVPIANIWKPYQAMVEIWQASKRPHDWGNVERSGLLPVWWTLLLFSGTLGRMSFRFSMRAEEIDEILTASWITLVSDLWNIPLTIVFFMLVNQISTFQNRSGAHR